MELPRIRQVIFHVSGTRQYQFDVNQNITVRGLKKMIIAAANLNKGTLQIFHKGVEYTENEDVALEDISSEQVAEFTITYHRDPLNDSIGKVKVNLGDYCPLHDAKFLYFYCYNCKKSICSLCMQGPTHASHDLIEKYDYLQSSKVLSELKFKDLTELVNIKIENKNDIDNLKLKIKGSYFPSLVELLKKIEDKLVNLVDLYNTSAEDSVKNLKENLKLVKEYCASGLEKLRDEINFGENMMIKEEVFLTFDRKYRELDEEKERFSHDAKRIEELQTAFVTLYETIEKVYMDLKATLESYLNSSLYNTTKLKVSNKHVELINKEEIVGKILSDVPKFRKSFNVRPSSYSKLDNSALNLSTYSQPPNNVNYSFSSNNIPSAHKKDIHVSPSTNNISSIFNTGANIQPTNFREPVSAQTYKKVLKCIVNTKEVAVFDNHTQDVTKRSLTFPPLFGIDKFLPNSAWINCEDKLYISGGQTSSGNSSNIFICYDYDRNNFIRMADLLTPRYSHSMIHHNDIIYVVGGHGTNSAEKYDIKTQKWVKLSNLNYDEKQNPVLYVYNNYLYSFFGYKTGSYVDTIERVNLKSVKAKWEVIPYKNPEKLDLRLIGCGILPEMDTTVIFIGGKSRDARRDAFRFDFATNTFTKSDILLEKEAVFQESVLIELEKNVFGHFDNEEGDHFLRLLNN
jgi:hypothetical protein